MNFVFRYCDLLAVLCIAVVLGVRPTIAVAAEKPNVLLICVDDLRPELACYGMDYIHSPHIDALAAEGVLFTSHYVQAPTCGASRNALLTGCYGGAGNDALFQRAKQLHAGKDLHPSMPAWFRQHGYTTVSVGKVSHHPGGRGGPDWDDATQLEMPNSWDRHLLPAGQWQHPRGWMHGLAHGEIRVNAGEMDLFQAVEGDDSIYPDGGSVDEALNQMQILAEDKQAPFFLAVGILRPHLPFGAPAKYLELYQGSNLPPILHPQKPEGKTTWHASGEFMKYNRWGRDPNLDAEFATEVRKHYAACVSYADAMVGKLIEQLKRQDEWDNTIIILWGDHGWHLGEHAIWGKHALFDESLRSPLIVRYPEGPQGQRVDSVVESVDVFPTLCELSGIQMPEFGSGSSLLSIDSTKVSQGDGAVSYFKKDRSLRTDRYRLIVHGDGFVELYDHSVDPHESKNVAEEQANTAKLLVQQLDSRHP